MEQVIINIDKNTPKEITKLENKALKLFIKEMDDYNFDFYDLEDYMNNYFSNNLIITGNTGEGYKVIPEDMTIKQALSINSGLETLSKEVFEYSSKLFEKFYIEGTREIIRILYHNKVSEKVIDKIIGIVEQETDIKEGLVGVAYQAYLFTLYLVEIDELKEKD